MNSAMNRGQTISPEPVLTLVAPGKVNLALEVLGRRDDGYHELRSLMLMVGLCDELRFWPSDDGGIEVVSDDPAAPGGETNLVHRAATLLREHCGITAGCCVELTKRIPVGGGMGGGSSDAATALLGLNRIWRCGLSREQLAEIGSNIGSDVPFFFHPPSAIVCGRGEKVRPVKMRWSGHIVLIKSPGGVSTSDVYARWSTTESKHNRSDATFDELAKAESADRLSPLAFNDLESAVFAVAPQVKAVRDSLSRLDRSTFRVSGAGSVLFDLFDDSQQANDFAERLRAAGVGESVLVFIAPFDV